MEKVPTGKVVLAVILLLSLAVAPLAQAGVSPASDAPEEVFDLFKDSTAECGGSQSMSAVAGTVPPATLTSNVIDVCVTNDALCGGCPSGTTCSMKAFYDPYFTCCTGTFSCVTSCWITPCNGLCAFKPE